LSYEITKDDSKALKGIAIILMIIHHLYAFPDRICVQLRSIISSSQLQMIGVFGKSCMNMFVFIGGYGIGVAYRKSDCHGIKYGVKYTLHRIKMLYITYWKVFLVFVPIAFLFFSNQTIYCSESALCTVYNEFDWCEFIANVVGIESTYNGEWWFFGAYIFVLLFTPCLFYVLDECPHIASMILFIMLCPILGLFPIGMAFGYYNIVEKIQRSIKLNALIDLIIIAICVPVAVLMSDKGIIGAILSVVTVLIFMYVSLDLCNKSFFVKSILVELGNKSAIMWLVHTFYLYYFGAIAKIITFSKSAFITLLILIAISYGTAVLFEKIPQCFLKIISRRDINKFPNS
jgi:peptidoglycan/LPS O-acetylase OafA/YrhL